MICLYCGRQYKYEQSLFSHIIDIHDDIYGKCYEITKLSFSNYAIKFVNYLFKYVKHINKETSQFYYETINSLICIGNTEDATVLALLMGYNIQFVTKLTDDQIKNEIIKLIEFMDEELENVVLLTN